MLEQQAKVTRVEGGKVTLISLQSSACSACAQQASCGTNAYNQFLPEREIVINSTLDVAKGDTVLVGIEEGDLVSASLFTYLLPLVVMLVIVGFFEGSEWGAILLAFAGLGFGLWLVNHYQYRFSQRWINQPKILSKC